jgi:hypothetical protein
LDKRPAALGGQEGSETQVDEAGHDHHSVDGNLKRHASVA